MVVVVVLGVSLVLYARDSRDINAEPRSQAASQADADHWHSAYGFYLCDEFVRTGAPLASLDDPLGIHTHEDGVIHIHPFVDGAAGRNATMGVFFDSAGIEMDGGSITFPDGEVWEEGETMCGDEPGRLVVAKWNDARDAGSEAPNELIEDDFDGIRFRADLEAYTIAFVPEGTEVPARPGIIESLETLTDVLEAPDLGGDDEDPADGSTTTVVEDGEDVTDTTDSTESDVDDTTTTTAPDDTDEDEATTTTAGV